MNNILKPTVKYTQRLLLDQDIIKSFPVKFKRYLDDKVMFVGCKKPTAVKIIAGLVSDYDIDHDRIDYDDLKAFVVFNLSLQYLNYEK